MDHSHSDQGFDSSPRAPVPPELHEGIVLFNAGDYFEAHEAWESLWRQSTGLEKTFSQGLIQLAAAFHHYSHGHYGAARRMYEKARSRLRQVPPCFSSIDLAALMDQCESIFCYDVAERQQAGIKANVQPQIRLLVPGNREGIEEVLSGDICGPVAPSPAP
jgi:hypothetical protein